MKFKTIYKKLFFIFFLLTFKVNSQTVIIKEDNVKLKFVKTKKASKIATASRVYVRSKNLKKILIKIKMKSINNERQLFDPNKLSLIDFINKLRYRPTDALYQNFTDWSHFKKISKSKPKKRFNTHIYKPDIPDTFLDFKFENIKNVEIPVNFNNKRNPDIHIIHFKPIKLRSRNIYLYFILPKHLKNAILYYGNEKVVDINFKR